MNVYLNNLNKIGSYLINTYAQKLPVLQTFSLVIIGILIIFVIHMTKKANTIGGKKDKFIDKWNLADMSKVKVMRAWNDIMGGIESGNGAKMKKSINDADKMFDEALKTHGFYGKNMEERLTRIDESRLPNLKEVLQAHKLSNRIKKEPALVLTQHEVKNIISIYRKAFEELGLIK